MYESTEQRLDAVHRIVNIPDPIREDRGVQTEKEVSYDHRRDWVGKQAKLNCDDRLIVPNNRQNCNVKKMTVYMLG